MREDDLGFLRPQFKPPPEQLALCPGRQQVAPLSLEDDDSMWGPVEKAWRGWATDEEIRFRGASGGVISALLIHLCESGEIDAVLHCGRDPKDPLKSISMISETRRQILSNAGSRYAPSATLSRIGELMETGLRFAAVGKPCEIDPLARIRGADPKLAAQMPYLISFFCAGVPSQKATERLAEILVPHGRRPVDFRYRGNGWPGSATARTRDGSLREMSYRESWGSHLSPFLQARCKLCADGIGMSADLVCADAWEVDASGFPQFEEAAGVNAILARTVKGRVLVEHAVRRRDIHVEPFDIRRLDEMQPGQVRRRKAIRARLFGLGLVGARAPKFRNYALPHRRGFRGYARFFRNSFGAALRVLAGRL